MKSIPLAFLCLFFSNVLISQCVSGDCDNGNGTFVYAKGSKYQGEFKDHKRHGTGTCFYSDGSRYTGEWMDGFPHGKGTKSLATGAQETGLFEWGVFKEGQTVEAKIASVKDHQFQSKGNRGCIEGDCVNGEGTFIYQNGERYQGSFVKTKPNGVGKMNYADGKIEEGFWHNGTFTGTEVIEPSHVRDCTNSYCSEGWGMYFYSGGDVYSGMFVDGAPQGLGTCLFSNGDRFTGEFFDHAPNGFGHMYFKNSITASGMWKNGLFTGEKVLDTSLPRIEKDQDPTIKMWAVVVGVSRYDHMPVLRYTDDDAYEMYAFLKSPEGGAVPDSRIRKLIDEDATKDKILGAMNEVFMQADSNDIILMYFSGHGLEGSFLPIDFNGFNNRLPHSEVRNLLEQSAAKCKIMIADACHSGSLMAAKGGGNPTSNSFYRAFEQTKGGTALILSSKAEETSLESNGLRHGVFSHYLIQGLKGKADANANTVVTINEAFDYVYDNVRAYTGNMQTPILKGSFDYDMPVGVAIRR